MLGEGDAVVQRGRTTGLLLPHRVPVDVHTVERGGLLRETRMVVGEAARGDVAVVQKARTCHVRGLWVHRPVVVSNFLPLLPLGRCGLLSGKEKGNGKNAGQSDDDEKLVGLKLRRGYHSCRYGVQLSRPGRTVELRLICKVAVKEAVYPFCTPNHLLVFAFLLRKTVVAVIAVVVDDMKASR